MGGQTTSLASLLGSAPPASAPPASASLAPQPLGVSDFAAKIRAKNPGAYDDLTDQDLTAKVLAKYPQYSDMVSAGDVKQQALSRTLQNMTYAMSGQSDQMHPDDKAEFDKGVKAGATSAAITTATGAASAALAPAFGPTVTGTQAVGTGILNPAGQEIMRDVTTYGPSVARQILSHPLTQSLLARAAGYAGAGYILKALGVFGKQAP